MSPVRFAVSVLFFVSYMVSAAEGSLKLEAAARGAHRTAENIARNDWRHPVETLQFFGIRDDMTVVEVWPGSRGWYTEVLAPYLRDSGVLYAANYDGSTGREYFARGDKLFREKLAKNPEIYDQVKVTTLMPPASLEAAPRASADLVVTFRNMHNWVRNGIAPSMFEAMFAALKPGGVLGVVAHRGESDMSGVEWATKGYVPEADTIKLAEAAGFTFVERSEINANPRDTKDYEQGVWTLPPTYRLGETDKDKYTTIGESDRMTLKFVKPNSEDSP